MKGRWVDACGASPPFARALAFCVLCVLLFWSCGGSGDPPIRPTEPPRPPEPTTEPPPPPPPPPPPRDAPVQAPFGSDANFDILDDTFVDPDGNHDAEAHVTVRSNQNVTWTQNGTNTHRVEFSKVPEGARSLDSKDLRPGTVWEFRPRVEGEYVFFCRYHEYMMDVRITVESP